MGATMALPEPSPESTCLITGRHRVSAPRSLVRSPSVARTLFFSLGVDRLESLASELSDEFGVRVEVPVATSATRQRAEVPDRVAQLGLTVELLVNNAGYGNGGQIVELNPEREVGMVRVNIEAVVALCSAFVPHG